MRVLVAGFLLAAATAASAVLPAFGDTNGDLLPDTGSWGTPRLDCAVSRPCVEGGASVDVVPGEDGLAQLRHHEGYAKVVFQGCMDPCPSAEARTFYDQPQGEAPDVTLHGIPDFGVVGEVVADPGDRLRESAWAAVRYEATDTDRNNSTRLSGEAPHDAGPVEGDAGAAAAVLVLLHHDRGFPHTRLAYLAPFAHECAYDACAALDLNHTYAHHDGDDDVVHEQQRVGFDDTLAAAQDGCLVACPPLRVHADGDAGVLLEDSFFVQEPPSGVSGDFAASVLGQPPLLAIPPAQEELRGDFAVRDPDRDFMADEARAELCTLDQCFAVGR